MADAGVDDGFNFDVGLKGPPDSAGDVDVEDGGWLMPQHDSSRPQSRDPLATQRQHALQSASGHFADITSAALLTTIAALHLGRWSQCVSSGANAAAPHFGWDWMCATDVFAELRFAPLHLLAAFTYAARLFLALRGGCGLAWRCFCRRPFAGIAASASVLRLLELYLACWALCWFAPPTQPKVEADCADTDASCPAWAASGECERNAAFMATTCRLACKLCTPGRGLSLASLLSTLALSATYSLANVSPVSGPRLFTLCVAGALLFITAGRVLFPAALQQLAACGPAPLSAMLRSAFRAARFAMSCSLGASNLFRRTLIKLLGGQLDAPPTHKNR